MFGLRLSALLLLASLPAAAAEPDLAAIFADLGDPRAPGCAVGVLRDGREIFKAAYGAADLATGRKLEMTTPLNIASLSKQFTAFAIFMLEREGRISLADSVRSYIPELGAFAQQVQLRHLLYHTGGLRDFVQLARLGDDTAGQALDTATGLKVLARQDGPDIAPGIEQTYSNTGYLLLGVIVERVTGGPIQDYLQRIAFTPLGMKHTRFGGPRAGDMPAKSYMASRGTYSVAEPTGLPVGAGGLYSTIGDLEKWSANYWTYRAGGRALVRRMLDIGKLDDGTRTGYAGGLNIEPYRGLRVASHGGSVEGFRTRLVVVPEQRFAALLLCNRSDAATGDRTDRMIDTALSARLRPKPAVPEIAQFAAAGRIAPAQARLGTYRDRKAAEYLEFRREGDTPVLIYRGATLPLRRADGNIWVTDKLQSYPIYLAFAADRISMSYAGYRDEFLHVPDWQPGDLQRFVGSYWSDEVRTWLRIRIEDGALTIALGTSKASLRPGTHGELVWGRGALGVPVSGPVEVIESRILGLRGVHFVRRDEPT